MSESEKAKYYKDVLNDVLPIGLFNLGNTCYLNSTLQIMKKIPELTAGINTHSSMTNSPRDSLIKELKTLFNNLDNMGKSLEPHSLVQTVFNLIPSFAQRTADQKSYQQQDADECFQILLQEMAVVLKTPKNPNDIEVEEPIIQLQDEAEQDNLIHSLFRIKMNVVFQNQENPIDKQDAPAEFTNKLTCIIADQTPPITYVNEGVKASLSMIVEKQSSVTHENAVFEKTMRMANMPPYLILQNMRFVWKQADEGTNSEARKAKVFKKITFPLDLDVNEFLCKELQEKLAPMRKKEIENELAQKDLEKEKYEAFKEKYKEKEIDSFKLHQMFKKEQAIAEREEYDGKLWSVMDEEKAVEIGNYI